LTDVLDAGPFEPGPWRVRANLPDVPVAQTSEPGAPATEELPAPQCR
jgi:hypothetical protein